MTEGAGPVSQAIQGRRSVRSFGDQAVQPQIVEALLKDACAAPAPHHSRPWRFVHLASRESRERLADAMSDAWRADLEAKGRSVHEVAKLLKRSQAQILEAPLLILTCLHLSGARHWPDEQRRRSERDM